MVNVKYGSKELDLDARDMTYADLPRKLESVYDVEIPCNVEIFADGEEVNVHDLVDSSVEEITISAKAEKKGSEDEDTEEDSESD